MKLVKIVQIVKMVYAAGWRVGWVPPCRNRENCKNCEVGENSLRCCLEKLLGTMLEIVNILKIVKLAYAASVCVGWVSRMELV